MTLGLLRGIVVSIVHTEMPSRLPNQSFEQTRQFIPSHSRAPVRRAAQLVR